MLNLMNEDIRQQVNWLIWCVHAVDDGTGVISCMCWKTPYNDPLLDTLPRLSGKF